MSRKQRGLMACVAWGGAVLIFLFLSPKFCYGDPNDYKICNISPWFEADANQLYTQVSQQSAAESIELSGPHNDWLTAAVMLIAVNDVNVTVSLDSHVVLEDHIQLRVMGTIQARAPNAVVWDPIMDPCQVSANYPKVINGNSIKNFPLLRLSSSTPAIIWITVDLNDVPYTGTFTSTLEFEDDDENTETLPLEIEILDAEIPKENPMHCFTWQHSTTSSTMINDLKDHGINVFHVNRQDAWDNGAKFMLFFFGTSWNRNEITDMEATTEDVRDELDIIWGFIEDNNVPMDQWAIMLADEVTDSTYAIDVNYAKLVKEYKPDTPICFNPALAVDGSTVNTTLNGAIVNIAPYCDIWIPYAGHLWGALDTGLGIYNYIEDQRINHGKRFWFYDILGLSGRRPEIGRSMYRRGPYVAWKYNLDGFNFYALNQWWSDKPWLHKESLNYAVTYSVGDPPIAGRGYEVLRQGIQEYKKMHRLKELGIPIDDIDEWADDCAHTSMLADLNTANDEMNQSLVQYTAIDKAKKATFWADYDLVAPFIPNIIDPEIQRIFKVDGFSSPPEVTPIVVGVIGGTRTYIHPGVYSMLCRPSGNDNIVTDDVSPAYSVCQQVIKPTSISSVNSSGVYQLSSSETDGQDNTTGRDIWNYVYDGAFGAVVDSNKIYVIRHNEHQNVYEGSGSPKFQGNIVPGRDVDDTDKRAGYDANGVWYDDPTSYASFVSLGKITFDTTDGNVLSYVDYGPVTWPSSGFLNEYPGTSSDPNRSGTGNHQSPTLFYPSSDRDPDSDDWMYAFYVNSSDTPTPGQGQGISVARALVGNQSGHLPKAWQTWQDPDWVQSIPADMQTRDMEDYYVYDANWNNASDLIIYDSDYSTTWFSVANLLEANGSFTGFFIGVECRVNDISEKWEMGLRFSKDLVNWTDFQLLYEATGGWGTGDFTYARFLNINGTSNNGVKLDNFYIYGINPSEGSSSPLYLMQIRLDKVIGAPKFLTDSDYGTEWSRHAGSCYYHGKSLTNAGYHCTDLYTCSSCYSSTWWYSIWKNDDIFLNDVRKTNTLEAYLRFPDSGHNYVYVELVGDKNSSGDFGVIGFSISSSAFTDSWKKYSYNFDTSTGMIDDVNSSYVNLRSSGWTTEAEKEYLLGHVEYVLISAGHSWMSGSFYVDDVQMVVGEELLTDSATGSDWARSSGSGSNGTTQAGYGYDGGAATKLYTCTSCYGYYYSIWNNDDLFSDDVSAGNTLELYLDVPTSGYSYVFLDLIGEINASSDTGSIGFRVNSGAFTGDLEKYSYNFDTNLSKVNDVINNSDFSLRTSGWTTEAEKEYLLEHITDLKLSAGHGWISNSIYVDDAKMVNEESLSETVPSGWNLAIGREASMNATVSSGNLATFAIDSEADTYAQSSSDTPWDLTVDLGEAMDIDKVTYVPDSSNYATHYSVQISTDNTNWYTIASVNNATGEAKSIYFRLTSARYVKLNVTQTQTVGNNGHAVKDFRVYSRKANLSIDKTATMNTTAASGAVAGYAADGHNGTYAQSSTVTPWNLTIDLGVSIPLINKVVYEPGFYNYATNYTIKVSTDNTNWTTVATVTDGDGTDRTHTFTDTTVRYVKLDVTQTSGSEGHIVKDLKIYKNSNLALDGTASMNTTPGWGNVASYAIDGSTSTYAQSSTVTPWDLTVDLGHPMNMDKVVFKPNYYNYATHYTIKVSNDNTNWTTVATVTGGDNSHKTLTFTETSARYVKLDVTQTTGENGHAVIEFEIYNE